MSSLSVTLAFGDDCRLSFLTFHSMPEHSVSLDDYAGAKRALLGQSSDISNPTPAPSRAICVSCAVRSQCLSGVVRYDLSDVLSHNIRIILFSIGRA